MYGVAGDRVEICAGSLYSDTMPVVKGDDVSFTFSCAAYDIPLTTIHDNAA